MMTHRSVLSIPFALLVAAGACRSEPERVHIAPVGFEHDLLAERVAAARDSHSTAQQQVDSTLQALRTVGGAEPAALDASYEHLAEEVDDSREIAAELRERIEAVEAAAQQMFDAWSDDSIAVAEPGLHRRSEHVRAAVRSQYDAMVAQMSRAEAALLPVVSAFEERVRLLGQGRGLQGAGDVDVAPGAIEDDVRDVVAELEGAVVEADEFLTALGEQGA